MWHAWGMHQRPVRVRNRCRFFFSNVSLVLLVVEPMAIRLSTLSTAKPLNAGSLEGGLCCVILAWPVLKILSRGHIKKRVVFFFKVRDILIRTLLRCLSFFFLVCYVYVRRITQFRVSFSARGIDWRILLHEVPFSMSYFPEARAEKTTGSITPWHRGYLTQVYLLSPGSLSHWFDNWVMPWVPVCALSWSSSCPLKQRSESLWCQTCPPRKLVIVWKWAVLGRCRQWLMDMIRAFQLPVCVS